MEEQNNNSNNNQNNQYTFFNMKDDHGFNDNITSKVESPKKALSGRLVFILAMFIIGVCIAVIATGIVTNKKQVTLNSTTNIHESYNEAYNRITNTRNKVYTQIQNFTNK